MEKNPQEAILIGAGIMSATLGILLKKINPTIKISVYERLDEAAIESSNAFNNAGTGHSAFCELNYTPENEDKSISVDKAINIAQQFEISKEFWSYLVKNKYVSSPNNFIHSTPHMSFVWGEDDVNFLRKRYNALSKHPLFQKMEFSEDPKQIEEWANLIVKGRDQNEKIAATRIDCGTDVDFGELTREIFNGLTEKNEISLALNHEVKDLKQLTSGKWEVKVKDIKAKSTKKVSADFVFIGAGGGAILLLGKSGIKESKGYGGFPVGGQWLICNNEEIIRQHAAKVYGKAKIGAPPMSVPHLDTRIIEGKRSLLFGPFATFSTKFLKNGSNLDLLKSLKYDNLIPMMSAGWNNIDLTKYLIEQVRLSKEKKIETLREYFPEAKSDDWYEKSAGQRVQVIEKVPEKGGVLKFGTEIITSKDGSIAALLGASPGASTSVSAMINTLKQCYPELMKNEWEAKIKEIIPSYGDNFDTIEKVNESRSRTKESLQLSY